MNKRKKVSYWIIASVIIVVIVASVLNGKYGKKDRIPVATEKVDRNTIIETVTANGEIQPETEVKISADVSGEIVELNVKEGQKVKKGDHLLTINPDLIKAAADRVAAALSQAKAALANARAREEQVKASYLLNESNFNRNKRLYEQKAISEAEFENIRSQFEAAKAELEAARQNTIASQYSVKSAEASLKEANDNLSRTRIYSPTDGTVSLLNVELGERVVGTAQMSGTELLRVANLTEMEVNALVNENDIVRVHIGDTASVEVEAYPGRKFRGMVTEIARTSVGAGTTSGLTASTGDKVVNFEVRIRILRESYEDLTDPERPESSPFFPGMNASVEISTRVEKNTLSVPIMAVSVRTNSEIEGAAAEGGTKADIKAADAIREVVFVRDGELARIVVVETGIQDNNFIQVKSGLEEGQEIIAAPYSAISKTLKNGSKIEVLSREELNKRTVATP